MPRAIKLSWQPGSGGRPGRWKKFYRGKMYFFPAGNGRSDMEGYDRAWLLWEAKKGEIDAATPRKHEEDYLKCLNQWEQIQAWSRQHAEPEWAGKAERKLAELRQRFTAPKLTPLRDFDWFEYNLDPYASPGLKRELERTVKTILELNQKGLTQEPAAAEEESSAGEEASSGMDIAEAMKEKFGPQDHGFTKPYRFDGMDARQVQVEVWRDRLATEQRKAAPKGESLGEFIETFLADKGSRERAKQITTGRLYALKLHLEFFRDWLGRDTVVKEIDGPTLTRFHGHLLEKITAGSWGRRTAHHYLASAKSFVRWLWTVEAIPTLPRVMEGRFLTISKPAPGIVTFTVEEVKTLLAAASDRTKLYVLLAINTGVTQQDLSDLLISEVDWEAGRIIRKRSKTKDEEHVPVVNYKLWPETFRLLKQERAQDGDRVLLNNNGSPLVSDEITAAGKYKKNDAVKSAFNRLRKKTKITKSLRSLRKTSATLLCDSEFTGLEGLFLGHAPGTVAAKHYARTPQQRFDQALAWLAGQYGLG